MLLVLSPAKSLDFESPVPEQAFTQPDFLNRSEQLIKTLRQLSPEELSDLMHISPKLAELNFERNLNWQTPFTPENARPAIYAFIGDVYTGLDVHSLDTEDIQYAQDHVRILSGLYGLLRPLDLMQAYRLEMGTSLKHKNNSSLYEYWGRSLAEKLNESFADAEDPVLINLASNEYFKAVDKKKLKARIISPVFKDYKNGHYKIISFFAKKARGMMAAWIIQNRIENVQQLEEFNVAGYRFSESDSSDDKPVFLRKQV